MSISFIALIYLLAIAALIFHFAKPIAVLFCSESDFLRRRNAWLALSVTAFLSPSFWVFVLVAVPLLIWGSRKDSNPIAFYLLLLHVIPPIALDIPVPGINQLFALNMYRLLSLFVLLPAVWRLRQTNANTTPRGLTIIDWLLLGFGVLQLVLFVPPDLPHHVVLQNSPTNVVRQAVLFYVDVYLVYYAISRLCTTRQAVADSMAAFCLAGALLALIAVFEGARHWLLYTDLNSRWGVGLGNAYTYMRENAVRAQAAAGHAIALGYLLTVALGFWLYLGSRVDSLRTRIAVAVLLVGGLIVTYARGPWAGAAVTYFAFVALSPAAFTRMFKALAVASVVAGALAFSPVGERIIKVLPFAGAQAESATAIYRQRLAERSWELIQQHPLFGDQFPYPQMEDLRQGEGIIDFVNAYAQVAIFYGVVGLALFFLPQLLALRNATVQARRVRDVDPDLASLGNSLVASMVGSFVVIATTSLAFGIQTMLFVLLGLATAFTRVARAAERR